MCESRDRRGCPMNRVEKSGKEVWVGESGIRGRNTSHVDVGVLMEFDPSRRFRHGIADVLISTDRKRLELLLEFHSNGGGRSI